MVGDTPWSILIQGLKKCLYQLYLHWTSCQMDFLFSFSCLKSNVRIELEVTVWVPSANSPVPFVIRRSRWRRYERY